MPKRVAKEFCVEIPDTKKAKQENELENKLTQESHLDSVLPPKDFYPVLAPQMMMHREYSKRRAMAQYKEIEYIKKYWKDENWSQVSADIKEKIESIKDEANTLAEFQEREKWLNCINEEIIRSKIDINTNLELNNKKLTRFPAALLNDDDLRTYWQRLYRLDLSQNQLTQIPPELGDLPALKHLYLSRNQLTQVPAELGKFQALESLYLDDNQLTQIPTELGNLQALESLCLHYNQLTQIPTELGNLQALESLYLHYNQLTQIPTELGNLQALENLSLEGNQLTQIPAELSKLLALRNLYIMHNQLTCEQLEPFRRMMGEVWLAQHAAPALEQHRTIKPY